MKCISWVKHKLKLEDEVEDAAERPYKGYYRYQSLEDIHERFREGLPISAVRMKGTVLNTVFAAYGAPRKMHLVPIVFKPAQEILISQSIPWSDCEILDQHRQIISSSREAIEKKIETYCVLFPCKREATQFVQKFACVFSDWDVIGKRGGKERSLLSHNVFTTSEYGH